MSSIVIIIPVMFFIVFLAIVIVCIKSTFGNNKTKSFHRLDKLNTNIENNISERIKNILSDEQRGKSVKKCDYCGATSSSGATQCEHCGAVFKK